MPSLSSVMSFSFPPEQAHSGTGLTRGGQQGSPSSSHLTQSSPACISIYFLLILPTLSGQTFLCSLTLKKNIFY